MPRPKKRSSPPAPTPDAPEDHGLPALSPDTVEQENGGRFDDVVPAKSFAKLPVVGMGGSAGGMAALQEFFGAMAPDCGMAFVVIMHLSPEHDSILAEVLQRATAMPVRQVRTASRSKPTTFTSFRPAST